MSKPDKAVEDARIMHANGYNAREIADALSVEYGQISRHTVYGWLNGRYRKAKQAKQKPLNNTNAREYPPNQGDGL